MSPGRFGCAQQGPKVIDVLDGVKDEKKRVLVFECSVGENLVYCGICSRFYNSYTALVNGSVAKLVKTRARNLLRWDMFAFSLLQDCGQV